MPRWIIYPAQLPTRCTCTASMKHLTHAFTSPRWKCTFGRRADKKGTLQSSDFRPQGEGKTTMLAAKQMQRSLFNLGSEPRVEIIPELWMKSQSGSLEGLRVALFRQRSSVPSRVIEWKVSGELWRRGSSNVLNYSLVLLWCWWRYFMLAAVSRGVRITPYQQDRKNFLTSEINLQTCTNTTYILT